MKARLRFQPSQSAALVKKGQIEISLFGCCKKNVGGCEHKQRSGTSGKFIFIVQRLGEDAGGLGKGC